MTAGHPNVIAIILITNKHITMKRTYIKPEVTSITPDLSVMYAQSLQMDASKQTDTAYGKDAMIWELEEEEY